MIRRAQLVSFGGRYELTSSPAVEVVAAEVVGEATNLENVGDSPLMDGMTRAPNPNGQPCLGHPESSPRRVLWIGQRGG